MYDFADDGNQSLLGTTTADGYHTSFAYDSGDSRLLNALAQDDQTTARFTFSSTGGQPVCNQVQLGSSDPAPGTTHGAGPPAPAIFFKWNKTSDTDVQLSCGNALNVQLTLDDVHATARVVQMRRMAGIDRSVVRIEQTAYTYDKDFPFLLAQKTLPTGAVTAYTYLHPFGLLATETRSGANRTSVTNHYQVGRQLPQIQTTVVQDNNRADQAAVTRMVYDLQLDNIADQPERAVLRFTISPEGRVTEQRYDAQNNVTTVLSYLDVAYLAVPQDSSLAPALHDMEQWVASGPGAKARVLREERQVDAVFQNTAARRVYARSDDDDNSCALTTFSNDAYGQIVETNERILDASTFSSTQLVRDSLQRITKETDALGHTTTTTFGPASPPAAAPASSAVASGSCYVQESVLPNNRLERVFLGSSGLSVMVEVEVPASAVHVPGTQAGVRQTTRNFDDSGRLVISTTTGLSTFTFSDDLDDQVLSVSATGQCERIDPVPAQRYTTTTTYASTMPRSAMYLGGEVTPAVLPSSRLAIENVQPDTTNDRVRTTFYDHAERPIFILDAENYLQELVYDPLSGSVCMTIAYAQVASEDVVENTLKKDASSAVLPVDVSKDRVSVSLYDRDGMLRCSIQPDGAMTESLLEAGSGRLLQQTKYSTQVSLQARQDLVARLRQGSVAATLEATLKTLRPLPSSADARHIYVYDLRGQVVGEVDAEGYLSVIERDPAGLALLHRRYDNPVSAQWLQTPVFGALPPLPAPSVKDELHTFSYDLLKRKTRENKFVFPAPSASTEGALLDMQESWTFDEMGQLTGTVKSDARPSPFGLNPGVGDATRGSRFVYDAWGYQVRLATERVDALLRAIEANTDLSPAERESQSEEVWQKYGFLRTFDPLHELLTATSKGLEGLTIDIYDDEKRVIASVAGSGACSSTTYTAFQEEASITRSYALAVNDDQRKTLGGGGLASANNLATPLAAILSALANDDTDEVFTFTRDRRGLVGSGHHDCGSCRVGHVHH